MAERKLFPSPNANWQALRQFACGWIITVGCPGVSLGSIVEGMEQRISWGALGCCWQQGGKGFDPGSVADTVAAIQERLCLLAAHRTVDKKEFVRVSLIWKARGRSLSSSECYTCHVVNDPQRLQFFYAALDSAWGWGRMKAQRGVLECLSESPWGCALGLVLPSFPTQSLSDSKAHPP